MVGVSDLAHEGREFEPALLRFSVRLSTLCINGNQPISLRTTWQRAGR